jgi:ABC-type cobalt transport system substrate-binding protein
MPQPMPEAQKSSHSEWFLAKLMKKFDLILVSKILLKLIIFKKIVIGIICLLMFIPILKKKFEEHTGESDEEEERRIKPLDDYGE